MERTDILDHIYDNIVDGDKENTRAFVQQALDADLPPGQILNEAMIAAMSEVGQLFEEGEVFVPEM